MRIDDSRYPDFDVVCRQIATSVCSDVVSVLSAPVRVSFSLFRLAIDSLQSCFATKKLKPGIDKSRSLVPLEKIRLKDGIEKLLSTDPSLMVEEYDRSKIDKSFRQVVETWEKVALVKMKSVTDPDELEIFKSATFIYQKINQYLALPLNTVYVCRDTKTDEVNALALTDLVSYKTQTSDLSGTYIELKFIATHPKNIRSEVNKNEIGRKEGSATEIISELALKVLKDGYSGIFLHAVDSSINFYVKLGFEYTAERIDHRNSVCSEMILSKSRIEELISVKKEKSTLE